MKGALQPSWTIANIIEEICITLGKFDSIDVSHEYREENSMANWFSNDAIMKDMMMIWNTNGNIPVGVKSLIEIEKIQGGTGEIQK